MGVEPTDKQLASSLRISLFELRKRIFESSLARENLAMSNVRLVMSIAQKYDNMGTAMADLTQVNLSLLNFSHHLVLNYTHIVVLIQLLLP